MVVRKIKKKWKKTNKNMEKGTMEIEKKKKIDFVFDDKDERWK